MCRAVLFCGGMMMLLLGASAPCAAETGGVHAPAIALADDDLLKELIRAGVETRPELRQAHAAIEAARERAPQVTALPDPSLSVGIQNDGFTSIQVGKMETSWFSIGAAQSFPWFGKRDLRAGVAEAQARRAEADLARAVLTVQAEMEGAYLNLLEIRDQMDLLRRLEALWSQSEAVARARYESGDGVQSDLLRAQLARSRLRQRRLITQAEADRRLLIINRLRGKAAGEVLATPRHLVDLADPVFAEVAASIAHARANSPELHAAACQQEQAERQINVLRRDAYPDLVVNAAVMPRGGQFETMWQAGIALNVPVWSVIKRTHAVRETQARAKMASANADAIGTLLEQRIRERHALMAALQESNRIYRSGLLVQSEATVTSTVAQYRVGKVPFASVLEAMGGYVTDVSGFLQSIAQAQRLLIAERALSLAGPESDGGTFASSSGAPAPEATGMGAPAMESNAGGDAPGTGGTAATSAMSKM